MIQSMTGYAAASADSPRGRLSLELRSVNSRFLDLQFRIAEELRSLEPALRESIVARISRGKVDCRLYLNDSAGAGTAQALDPEAVARLKALSEQARKAFPDAAPLRVADILRWPGMVSEPMPDDERTYEIARALCREALEELLAARAREGAKLATVILERVAAMRSRVEAVAPLVPQSIAAYRAKIEERLKEALATADDERIRSEIALFASKVDIDEELERLRAHLAEVERTLGEGGARGSPGSSPSGSPRSSPVGKRLDFLAQELNREANTLASKAASAPVADCALELKLLIEQVREQVQNIE
jgi:uncharacterized protein (TIGR00255 family)